MKGINCTLADHPQETQQPVKEWSSFLCLGSIWSTGPRLQTKLFTPIVLPHIMFYYNHSRAGKCIPCRLLCLCIQIHWVNTFLGERVSMRFNKVKFSPLFLRKQACFGGWMEREQTLSFRPGLSLMQKVCPVFVWIVDMMLPPPQFMVEKLFRPLFVVLCPPQDLSLSFNVATLSQSA